MNPNNNFTFISPLPHPIEYVENNDSVLRLDNFNAHECVEFFWRTKRVLLNAELSIFYQGDGDEIPLYNETQSTTLDSSNSECVFSMPMHKRPLYTNICNISNMDSILTISGPYYSQIYDDETDFSMRTFEYHLGFFFGVGNIEISSTYIPNATNGNATITANRFPFKIFGRTFYLNLNVPKALLTPEEYGLIASFSGNAELIFEQF